MTFSIYKRTIYPRMKNEKLIFVLTKNEDEVFRGTLMECANYVHVNSNTISSVYGIKAQLHRIRDLKNKSCNGYKVKTVNI